MRSPGFRFFVTALLVLLMGIPLLLAAAVIDDRASYARQTRAEVGREWGGPQTLSGPVLVVPVEGVVLRRERREAPPPPPSVSGDVAAAAEPATEQPAPREVTIRTRARVAPLVLLPDALEVETRTETGTRSRGLFEVPVFAADIALRARFDPARLDGVLGAEETPLWDEAVLRLGLGSNAGLRGETEVAGPDGSLRLEPFSDGRAAGVEAALGDASAAPFEVTARLTLNGAQRLFVAPVGRDSRVTMRGDWPDPSFAGAFLPDARTVGPEGYEASWTIPHLARALPQVARGSIEPYGFAFGTEFLTVNDFYQKAFRAARYGILFIALTFLTVLLTERRRHPTHPVQYVLIGLAQSIFVLLMVAYAEQIGFTPAYLLASAATIALITFFGWSALRLGRRTWVLGALLTALYAVLYLILRSADLALLAGATLAFGALALTMVVTRNETWYGPAGPGQGVRPRAPAHPDGA